MPDKKSRMVVVFGGSFSPPTLAHVEIIHRCLSLPGADEIWLVPSSNRTDKNIACSPSDQLAMLQLLIKHEFGDDQRLHIVETEIRRGIETETYDTYQEFLRDYPQTKFWFVYGSDSYATIGTWLKGEWLQAQLPVMLVERNDEPLPPVDKHIRHLPPLPKLIAPISSTLVRTKINAQETIHPFVPTVVATYLKQNKLFVS